MRYEIQFSGFGRTSMSSVTGTKLFSFSGTTAGSREGKKRCAVKAQVGNDQELEPVVCMAQRVPELVTAHGSGGGLGAEQSRKWSAIHLISDGKVVEDNARFAPLTIELYERLGPPKIAGRSPNLMFSLLDPKTSIPPHHGIINTRLVLHIPLIVPNDCALRVGDETRTWEPGTAMIFDDTIEHEAWNDSDALRVVLLGDVWRPELDAGEQAAIARLMARE